jgi:hypothetical protein
MTTTTTIGRTRLLRRGVIRHEAPNPKSVDLRGEPGVFHTLVTVQHGDVHGELVRWVWSDGEIGYEARINGVEDSAGVCDVIVYDEASVNALMHVCMDLGYEWRWLLGYYPELPEWKWDR